MRVRRVPVVAALTTLIAAVALAGGAAPVAAAPVELFSETTPGVYDDVVSVPAGVCFVSIVADGGHGGGGLFADAGRGRGRGKRESRGFR